MRLLRLDFISALFLAVIVVLSLSLALISYNLAQGKPIVNSFGLITTVFVMIFTGFGVGSKLFRRRRKEISSRRNEDVLELKNKRN